MMKTLVIMAFVLSVQNLYATEARLIDGYPQFAVAKVNDVICWTEQDKQEAIASFETFSDTAPVKIEDLVPTDIETAIRDSGIKFDNFSEFKKCVKGKDTLDDKILDMKPSEAKEKEAELIELSKENEKRE